MGLMKKKATKKLPSARAKLPKSGVEGIGKALGSAGIDIIGHKLPPAGSKLPSNKSNLKGGKFTQSDFY